MSKEKQGAWKLQEVRDQILAGVWKFYPSDLEFGSLFMSGRGLSGEIGDGTTNQTTTFKEIPGGQWGPTSGVRFNFHSVKSDGTLWAWGSNSGYVTLGLNTSVRGASSPAQIPGTNWRSTGSSGLTNHQFATKKDNTLWVWGINCNGDLGLNNLSCTGSPTQIPGSWVCAQSGYRISAGITTSGTLFTWGCGNQGGLGLNSNVSQSAPTQVPGNSWSAVYVGFKHMYAKKTDGTLWQWGGGFCTNNNNAGIGGDNTSIGRSSPTQIPGTQWVCVSAGQYAGFAVKADGTAWVWGVNNAGRLGLGDTTARSSPVQLPGNNWYKFSGAYSSTGVKIDGTLWVWGGNSCGQLGLGNTTARSSPTQIPGTNWIDAGTADSNTFARSK